MTTNGQLLIGSTAAPNIRVGSLATADGSITVTTGAGTIDIAGTQASTAQKGSVTLATNAEAIAGTDTQKVITPDDLKAKLGTQTSHGVLVGAGTAAAVTALAVGTTGQLLVGSTGADPAFGSSASADFTFTTATAGATRTLTVSNTDNTNAASNALVAVSTGGASAGDAYQTFSTTTTTWSMGVDNSVTTPAADPFVISKNSTLGTNNTIVVDTSGRVSQPLQPCFSVYSASAQNNVTGDGTNYQITWDTELYDVGNNFATNTFTAPVTGKYLFTFNVQVSGLAAGHTIGQCEITTTARRYLGGVLNPIATSTSGSVSMFLSCIADMTAGDTAVTKVQISGSTKVVGIVIGSATALQTWWEGSLLN